MAWRYIPLSIDRSGTKDVSRELNEWFSKLPDNTIVGFNKNARYKCESGLYIRNKNNLTIRGNMAEIFADTVGEGTWVPPGQKAHLWPRRRTLLTFRECVGTTIESPLRLTGPNTDAGPAGDFVGSLEAQHGLELFNCLSWNIAMPEVRNVYGDFIFIGGNNGSWCGKFTNDNNLVMSGAGRQGVGIQFGGAEDSCAGTGIEFENILMANIRRSAWDFEPYGPADLMRVNNILVKGGISVNYKFNFVAAGSSGEVSNIRFEDHITDRLKVECGNNSEEYLRRKNWQFLRCTGLKTVGQDGAAMKFRKVDGAYVVGCKQGIIEDRSELAVSFRDCTEAYEFWNDWPIMNKRNNTEEVEPSRQATSEYVGG